jgi:hypothetical protein
MPLRKTSHVLLVRKPLEQISLLTKSVSMIIRCVLQAHVPLPPRRLRMAREEKAGTRAATTTNCIGVTRANCRRRRNSGC